MTCRQRLGGYRSERAAGASGPLWHAVGIVKALDVTLSALAEPGRSPLSATPAAWNTQALPASLDGPLDAPTIRRPQPNDGVLSTAGLPGGLRMTPDTNAADDPVVPAPPSGDQLARWLLIPTSPQDQQPEAVLLAAEDTYDRLRAHLAVSLGHLGFDALWARALQLAIRQFAPHDARRIVDAPAPGVRGLVRDCDPDQIPHVLQAVFASFFRLLATFIGETLMIRIVYQLWPALAERPAESMPQKEIDHESL